MSNGLLPIYNYSQVRGALQFTRQLPAKDLDRLWREYEGKTAEHYKSKLQSFRVVQLSKLDPDVRKWISDQGKHETKAMDDLLNDMGEGKGVADRRKGRGENHNWKKGSDHILNNTDLLLISSQPIKPYHVRNNKVTLQNHRRTN